MAGTARSNNSHGQQSVGFTRLPRRRSSIRSCCGGDDGAQEKTFDAIGDHNDIRDALHEAARHEVGSAPWWEAVGAARAANTEHMGEEEDEAVADFRRHADMALRERLGREFLEFKARHPDPGEVDTSSPDPQSTWTSTRAPDEPHEGRCERDRIGQRCTMTREANIATQERAAAHLNAGEIDAGVDALFATNAVDHDPAPGQPPGREGFRAFFHELAAAFPDAQLKPAAMSAHEDTVCLAYTLTGTHKGPFQGIEPTGKQISVRGLQIARFENAQIVERWGSTDELGIMRQLGVMAPAPDSDEPSHARGMVDSVMDKLRG
ncbi:MAG: ester cyclase [Sporichthyaceae bacterium]